MRSGERLLDLVSGGGRGEDEAQVAVPVRERADRLADGDRNGQAGDPWYGGGAVPAFDGAQHARARDREHVYSGGLRGMAGGGDRLAEGAGQDELFEGLAAGEAQRA
jgi:hypothetical protein